MSGDVAAMTPERWNTNPVTSSSLSANTCLRSITPSPFVSERIEIVSSGSRSCRRRSDPLSFHGSVFGSLRPLGYSGVSETHKRPRSSQSMFIAFCDERLGGDERQVELRVHLDRRGGLGGSRGSALDVAQAVAELVFLQELVDVRAFSGPRDSAQQDRAVVRAVEILVEMPGDRHERPVRRAAAVSGALVGPHLRLHVVRC